MQTQLQNAGSVEAVRMPPKGTCLPLVVSLTRTLRPGPAELAPRWLAEKLRWWPGGEIKLNVI